MDNIWLPLITGLTTGGLSCFAVQGGLLTSILVDDNIHKKGGLSKSEVLSESASRRSVLMFLVAKLIAYTSLGAVLGSIGSAIVISPIFQGWMLIIVGFFMIATAGRLLDLHPIFRYFVIQPPKTVMRLVRNGSKMESFLTPAFLGTLTILIPCGVTQAMMLLAVSTGSAYLGASTMFFFILGTSPVFFLIGMAATNLLKNKAFTLLASLFIVILGATSLNSGQILRGSAHTFQNYWKVLTRSDLGQGQTLTKTGIVNITVTSSGYKADVNTLKLGVPVTLKLTTKDVRSCALAFTIPAYNITKVLPSTGTTIIEFTPTKLGNLTFACSMGMYSGNFTVVK